MSPLSQQNEQQAGDCSNIVDRQPRTHDRRSASSSSAHVDQSAQVIAVVARTRRNELQCSNLANTREQLRVVIERGVDRACTRCGMGLAASGEHHEEESLCYVTLCYINSQYNGT